MFVAILATSCNAQNSDTPKDKIVKSETSQDSNAKPKGSWKVNKEVDENCLSKIIHDPEQSGEKKVLIKPAI